MTLSRLLTAFVLVPATVAAQAPTTPAAHVADVVSQVAALKPSAGMGADVHGLTLVRAGGTLRFDDGRLVLLTPVDGRVIGAVFTGHGTFTLSLNDPVEEGRMAAAFDGQASPTITIQSAVLLFADSTEAELRHGLAFGTGAADGGGAVSDALDLLGGEHHTGFDVALVEPLLNRRTSGYFSAYLEPAKGQPLEFTVDPTRTEAVTLSRKVAHMGPWKTLETVVSTRAPGQTAPETGDQAHEATITRYVLDVRLPEATDGGVRFSATGTMDVTADTATGPWVPFLIYPKIAVDSATGDGVVRAEKADDDPVVWVRFAEPLTPGTTRTLGLGWHGNVVDRFGDLFFVNTFSSWYPTALDGRNAATFDLTYHSPEQYLLASAGERVDSAGEPGHLVRTRWTVATPLRNASFNLGAFAEDHLTLDGVPPVTLLYSAHSVSIPVEMSYEDENGNARTVTVPVKLMSDKKARQNIGEDLLKALKFFGTVYGPPPVEKFYASEIPYAEGVAFPGMIDLSISTFHGGNGSPEGFDEFFRAHEVSHQWWGVSTDFATYRDQWLSEGMATFSGLWFVQTGLKDNQLYFDYLDRYQNDIASVADAGPVSIGWRTASAEHPSGYNVLVYEKGAWVAHMLRILMLDLRTMNEDRFTQTLQDYVGAYRGGRGSTADFQRVVERHLGIPMDWFFREWLDGTGIPTYKVAWKAEPTAAGSWTTHLRVDQSGVPDDFQMYVPVTLDLGGGRIARMRVLVKGPHTETDLPAMPAEPKKLVFNDLHGVLANVKMTGW